MAFLRNWGCVMQNSIPPSSPPSGPATGFINGLNPKSKFLAAKPMRPKSRYLPSSGFTLTELLIVIVIIVTLAALSVVGIRRMRDMADKTAVMRSLSQIQLANASYATDNAGKYLPKQFNGSTGGREGWWYDVPEFLVNFRGEVMGSDGKPSKTVPLSMLDPKVVRTKRSFYNSMAGSFGYNETGIPSSGGMANARYSYTVATIPKPEQSMAFATATDVSLQYRSRLTWFSRAPGMRDVKTSTGDIAYRHGDKIIAIFFDGHVEEVSKAQIEAIDKTKGGANSAFWRPNP
jgi:prepilin-type N-terminal cleavage/methylation domain-containing protein/prepilin-type processing-associated H-X9-DG protein